MPPLLIPSLALGPCAASLVGFDDHVEMAARLASATRISIGSTLMIIVLSSTRAARTPSG
jgi:hypothetical protein